MKIIDLQKELPHKFKWKDNVYKLDGERYFRESDNWEPTFYLFQLDEEVEIIEEEKEIEKFDYTRLDRFAIYNNGITKSDREHLDSDFEDIAIKINELINVINDMRDKEC